MEQKSLFQIYRTEAQRSRIILENVARMLGNRIYVRDGKKYPLLNPEEALKSLEDKGDHVYIIPADNGTKYALKIVFQKITTISKQSIIAEFLENYAGYQRIIVASDYTNKIAEYILKRQTQLFREFSFLQDIISYRDQPRFELLSPEEMEQVRREYQLNEYTFEKMLRSDPVAKYFALKKGDLIRIIRPSPTAGESIAYRIVL
jgi:DNA-directed RNA polymerase subunit H (RpoH/RPB5)